MKPLCACPGKVQGKIVFFHDKKRYNKKEIVVMKDWLTQNVIKAKGAGGIISSTGSLTSHASIIARELGIPTIINYDTSNLHEGESVEMDSSRGVIHEKV